MAIKGLLMTPGSGGSTDHPTFHQLVDELELPVVLYDFEYRRAGKRSPGRADRLIGEVCDVVTATAERLDIGQGDLAIGGRSMGGRVCSMAAASGLACAGLVLLSYPLHPPGKPDRLRADHWPDITVPSLFVSGPKDPFGTPAEFDEHLPKVAGPVSTRWLESGNHDPRNRAQRNDIVSSVSAWLESIQ